MKVGISIKDIIRKGERFDAEASKFSFYLNFWRTSVLFLRDH